MNPPDESAANETGPRRVLMVDDDKKFCRLLVEYLKPMGYEVVAVHTGPEGVEQALASTWHAVLLDVMLPGIDGLEVLRRIRASSNVPVLMLTARGEETDRIVGLEVGADDYLPKTFSARELLARLRSVTRRAYRRTRDSSADRRRHPDWHAADRPVRPWRFFGRQHTGADAGGVRSAALPRPRARPGEDA